MAEIGPYFFALGSQTVAPNFFDLGANGSSEFFCTVQRWAAPTPWKKCKECRDLVRRDRLLHSPFVHHQRAVQWAPEQGSWHQGC